MVLKKNDRDDSRFKSKFTITYRSSYINRDHGGCANDAGWLLVAENQDACPYVPSAGPFPVILFSSADTYVNRNEAGYNKQADVLAITVKFKKTPMAAFSGRVRTMAVPSDLAITMKCACLRWGNRRTTVYLFRPFLAFRLTAGVNQSAYDKYVDSGTHDDTPQARASLLPGCLTLNGSLPCNTHYRSRLLDEWPGDAIDTVG
nr:hypothetical protein BaRGS_023901 [Batillaria attramentaria]